MMKVNSKASHLRNRNSFWRLCEYYRIQTNRIRMTAWWLLNSIQK